MAFQNFVSVFVLRMFILLFKTGFVQLVVFYFQEFFENPAFRPDGLKLYPTLVIRGTGEVEKHSLLLHSRAFSY